MNKPIPLFAFSVLLLAPAVIQNVSAAVGDTQIVFNNPQPPNLQFIFSDPDLLSTTIPFSPTPLPITCASILTVTLTPVFIAQLPYEVTVTDCAPNPDTTTWLLTETSATCISGSCLPQQSQVIGGKIIPIESTSLLLASTQSFSWMIPVVLSVLGIGLFVIRRK